MSQTSQYMLHVEHMLPGGERALVREIRAQIDFSESRLGMLRLNMWLSLLTGVGFTLAHTLNWTESSTTGLAGASWMFLAAYHLASDLHHTRFRAFHLRNLLICVELDPDNAEAMRKDAMRQSRRMGRLEQWAWRKRWVMNLLRKLLPVDIAVARTKLYVEIENQRVMAGLDAAEAQGVDVRWHRARIRAAAAKVQDSRPDLL